MCSWDLSQNAESAKCGSANSTSNLHIFKTSPIMTHFNVAVYEWSGEIMRCQLFLCNFTPCDHILNMLCHHHFHPCWSVQKTLELHCTPDISTVPILYFRKLQTANNITLRNEEKLHFHSNNRFTPAIIVPLQACHICKCTFIDSCYLYLHILFYHSNRNNKPFICY